MRSLFTHTKFFVFTVEGFFSRFFVEKKNMTWFIENMKMKEIFQYFEYHWKKSENKMQVL